VKAAGFEPGCDPRQQRGPCHSRHALDHALDPLLLSLHAAALLGAQALVDTETRAESKRAVGEQARAQGVIEQRVSSAHIDPIRAAGRIGSM
jgi:hypothetical protein